MQRKQKSKIFIPNIRKTLCGLVLFSFLSFGSAQQNNTDTYLKDAFLQKRNRIIQLQDYQKYFNNVYKSQVLAVSEQEFKAGAYSGTFYNFVDKEGKSFYLGVKHCVIPPEVGNYKITLRLKDVADKNLEAKIEEIIKNQDLIVLSSKADNHKSKTECLLIKDVYVGEPVFVAGYARGEFKIVKKSNVAAKIIFQGKSYLVLDERVCNGLSGSPVFVDRNGKLYLAGIVGYGDNNKGVHFAIPADYFKEVLDKYK